MFEHNKDKNHEELLKRLNQMQESGKETNNFMQIAGGAWGKVMASDGSSENDVRAVRTAPLMPEWKEMMRRWREEAAELNAYMLEVIEKMETFSNRLESFKTKLWASIENSLGDEVAGRKLRINEQEEVVEILETFSESHRRRLADADNDDEKDGF